MFVCQGLIYTKCKLPAGHLLTSPTPTPSSQSAVVPAKHRHPSVHQSPPQPHPNALFPVLCPASHALEASPLAFFPRPLPHPPPLRGQGGTSHCRFLPVMCGSPFPPPAD